MIIHSFGSGPLISFLGLCVVLGFVSPRFAGASEPNESEGLRDLSSISQLKKSFNEDRGKARLILLFSPT